MVCADHRILQKEVNTQNAFSDSFIQSRVYIYIYIGTCQQVTHISVFSSDILKCHYNFLFYFMPIGRTGRAGRPGKAITFFTEDDTISLRR
jgi:hypothetical protein